MKVFMMIGAGIGLAGLIYFAASRSRTPAPSQAQPVVAKPASPAALKMDPAEIFKKAFWKHPNANDKILHAERREWSGDEGVKKWQWFLVVEPSPELVKYLREDNTFGLVPSPTVPSFEEAPEWFVLRSGEVDGLRAPNGNMRLFFNKNQRLLHATSNGTGFRPGAIEPVKPAIPSPRIPAGRLPNHPPPNP